VNLVAPAVQPVGHQVGGGVFLVSQFGVAVDLPPDGDHLVFVGADLVERGQRQRGIHAGGSWWGDGTSSAAMVAR